MIEMNRREFFRKAAVVGFGSLVTMTLSSKAKASQGALKAQIGRNHGHTLTVTLNELLRNGPRIYQIKGNSLHSHKVEVTAEILKVLQREKIVEIESSSDFMHDHLITLEII